MTRLNNPSPGSEYLIGQSLVLTILKKQPFENTVGKGENAGTQHFLLFPQCFLTFQRQSPLFEPYLFCSLQMFSI